MVLSGGSASWHNSDSCQTLQSFGTVLCLTSSRVGYAVVNRLIDQGGNVHAKQQYQHQPSSTFQSEMQIPWDVTALHVSSMYWNTEAVQALLDRGGRAIKEELSCCDSNGRLPLHWAAAGPGSFECWLSDVQVSNRIISALKLLCSGSDVDAGDHQGETALHYAIRGQAAVVEISTSVPC
jgi:ankyrin repeat protein